jgi:hypothetical protein
MEAIVIDRNCENVEEIYIYSSNDLKDQGIY